MPEIIFQDRVRNGSGNKYFVNGMIYLAKMVVIVNMNITLLLIRGNKMDN